jgi:hypothetical protein
MLPGFVESLGFRVRGPVAEDIRDWLECAVGEGQNMHTSLKPDGTIKKR